MRVAVLADTHTFYGARASRAVPAGAWPFLETADHILHAGDVCDPALLDELAALAPVTVVAGNCDGPEVRAWGAPEEAQVELAGVSIGMIHDSGPKKGRRRRVSQRFPGARAVVFGHSHIPLNEDSDGLLLFNPGSPTWKRRAPYTSMGVLWIEDGRIEGDIVSV